MLIVAFEGPDGIGKSTQSELLANKLRSQGFKVYSEHFPRYETPIGGLIGDILKGNAPMPSFEAMQMLYAADQTSFSDKLFELLKEKYDYVILDRYYLSTIVYYCTKKGDKNLYPTVLGWQTGIIPPDLTIVMTSDKTINDKEKYKDLDEFEKDTQFMKNINKNYVSFAKILRGSRPLEIVHSDGTIEEVGKRIENKLKKWELIH